MPVRVWAHESYGFNSVDLKLDMNTNNMFVGCYLRPEDDKELYTFREIKSACTRQLEFLKHEITAILSDMQKSCP